MRWLLTGDEFDAHEAYRMGLVQEVMASEDTQEGLQAMLERRPGNFQRSLGTTNQVAGRMALISGSSE
jgi:enoyl-CoA hydratase